MAETCRGSPPKAQQKKIDKLKRALAHASCMYIRTLSSCVCGVCVYHLPCTYHLHHLCTQAIYNHLVLDTTVIDLALNRIRALET